MLQATQLTHWSDGDATVADLIGTAPVTVEPEPTELELAMIGITEGLAALAHAVTA